MYTDACRRRPFHTVLNPLGTLDWMQLSLYDILSTSKTVGRYLFACSCQKLMDQNVLNMFEKISLPNIICISSYRQSKGFHSSSVGTMHVTSPE